MYRMWQSKSGVLAHKWHSCECHIREERACVAVCSGSAEHSISSQCVL